MIIPTITIVRVCQFMFSTILSLSATTYHYQKSRHHSFVSFSFSFVLFDNSHRLVLVCGVAGAGGAGAAGGDNEGKFACASCLFRCVLNLRF